MGLPRGGSRARAARAALPQARRHLGSQRPRPATPRRGRPTGGLARRPTGSRGGIMRTGRLGDGGPARPRGLAGFRVIPGTKRTDRVSNLWRALATNPEHLELCWTRLKAIMRPGKVDLLTKEIIALAVSATNGCNYCINSHTAAVQKLGLDDEALGEVLAVVGLFNAMNKLADAYQVTPDILPEAARNG